ncbi:hypothetical protein BgiBS90_010254, partial [Biomphalaria glabrata]
MVVVTQYCGGSPETCGWSGGSYTVLWRVTRDLWLEWRSLYSSLEATRDLWLEWRSLHSTVEGHQRPVAGVVVVTQYCGGSRETCGWSGGSYTVLWRVTRDLWLEW